MDPRIAARRRRVQETRARSAMGRVLVAALILGLAGLAAWVLLRSGWFDVASIEVTGAARTDVSSVLTEAGVTIGEPLVSIRTGDVEQRLLEDPWIRSATVTRRWPDGVVVLVDERTPAAVVNGSDGLALVAADGVVLERVSTAAGNRPLVDLPGVALADLGADPTAKTALDFAAALRQDLASGAVIATGGEGLEATVAGFRVVLGGPEDGGPKARALAAVIDQNPPVGSVISVVAPTRPAVGPPETSTSATSQPQESSP